MVVILTWNSDYKIELDPKGVKKGDVKVKKEGASVLHSLTHPALSNSALQTALNTLNLNIFFLTNSPHLFENDGNNAAFLHRTRGVTQRKSYGGRIHLVSPAAVFWMSRNVGETLRDIQKTAVKETRIRTWGPPLTLPFYVIFLTEKVPLSYTFYSKHQVAIP